MIYETHAHLNSERFDADRDEVIDRIQRTGIERLINVGDSLEASRECIAFAKKYDFIYAAVGIHPENAGEHPDTYIDELRELAHYEKTCAVGEIGLDYYWKENPPRELQKEVFERQLELAEECSLPVIIHSRDAAEDTFEIMSRHKGRLKAVLHCYSYSPEYAARAIKELGVFIGVGGVVTFKNAKKLVETVEKTDLSRIFLETDCPYMAPEPYRGKRCDSSYLPLIAEKIAQIKGVSVDEVFSVTYENALNFFKR